MPAVNIQSIRRYSFSSADRLFFDTNIWLLIYGPQGDPNDRRTRIYTSAFRDIITNRSRIYIDALTISEFINRYARMKADLWMQEYAEDYKFKDFRRTPAFRPIAQEIEMGAHDVLRDSVPIESDFTHIDQKKILKAYGLGNSDFNDLMVIEICRKNKLVLLTDDSDFAGVDIPILTENPILLRG